MSAKPVSDATFAVDVLASDLPVLVDFWSPSCGPCRMMAPMIDEIAVASAERLTVVKVNIAENPATADACNVRSVPTLTVVVAGEVVKTITGAKTKAALLRELAAYA